EMDEMWSLVMRKKDQRWLWHAIDHATGAVLAYVFGRRKDEVFLQLQALLEPFGLTRFYTDHWARTRDSLTLRSCTRSLRLIPQPENPGKVLSLQRVYEGVLPWSRLCSSTSSR